MAAAESKRSRRKGRVAPQAELRRLDDLRQVRAMADPLRMKILAALGEERTTKQVAEFLREKPTRLYHHVDALERAGLVQLTRTQQKRGTVEKYYRSVARTFEARVSTGEKSAASRGTIDDLVGATLGNTASEIRSLLQRGDGRMLEREGLLAFLEVQATKAELADLRRSLGKLLESVGEEKKGSKGPKRRQRYRLTIAFFPLPADGAAPPGRKRAKGAR